MKITILTLFAISLSLLGAETKEVNIKTLQKRGKVGSELAYLPNQDTPFSGKAVQCAANGQKILEENYKDGELLLRSRWDASGQKRGIRNFKNRKIHGPWVSWYGNGQKKDEGNYVEQKQDGFWTRWYENGQKKLEGNYKFGFLMSVKVWKPNGEKCPKTNLKDGNGVMLWYGDDGTARSQQTYKDGNLVKD